MADQFVAEIRVFPLSFSPKGWAFCNGQLLPISQNTALFSLLGTTYGGDGISNFALPNLQGSAPLHVGGGGGPGLSSYSLGQTGGEQSVTLTASNLPTHIHAAVQASQNVANQSLPAGQSLGSALAYASATGAAAASAPDITGQGNPSPHNNLQPYLTLNFCIALQGIFPPRS